MPLKNGTRYCVNHPEVILITNADLNAVPGVTLGEDLVDVNLGKVVLCKVYACPTCGYLELYWPKEKATEYYEKQKKAVEDAAKQVAAETSSATSASPPSV